MIQYKKGDILTEDTEALVNVAYPFGRMPNSRKWISMRAKCSTSSLPSKSGARTVWPKRQSNE